MPTFLSRTVVGRPRWTLGWRRRLASNPHSAVLGDWSDRGKASVPQGIDGLGRACHSERVAVVLSQEGAAYRQLRLLGPRPDRVGCGRIAMTFLLRRACFALWLALALAAIGGGLQPATAAEPKRLALVVGNSAYSSISALVNPTNDATDIAAKLKTLQFEVLLGIDATHAKMTELLHQFKGKLTRDHIALVFYAGHGVTVNNESFLLPVDMPAVLDLDAEGKLTANALNRHLVSMAAMLAPLEDAKIGIVFLDACRTNLATPGLGLTLRTASVAQSRTARIMRGTGALDVKPSPYSAGVFRAY